MIETKKHDLLQFWESLVAWISPLFTNQFNGGELYISLSTLFKVESGAAKPSMPPELLYPLIASAVVMLVFYLYLLLLRLQTEKRRETLNQLLAEIQN